MLLQDSLGGDSKALMFCNVAPVAVHAADTFSSLAFASKVGTAVLCRAAGPARHVMLDSRPSEHDVSALLGMLTVPRAFEFAAGLGSEVDPPSAP